MKRTYVLLLFITGLITIGGFFASLAEAAPKAVYVDVAYTDDNAGGYSFGVDAFTSIQDGVDAVAPNGTVFISAGVYDGQIVIDGKSVTLQGAGDATVIQPSGPNIITSLYVYPSDAPLWSGTEVAGIIFVENSGVRGVTILDLKVDGNNVTTLPSGAQRLAGILYAESGGVIQNVTVSRITTNDATVRTHGIAAVAFGAPVSIDITDNRITDFLRNGIQVMGNVLTVNIFNNTVTGLADSHQITNGIALVFGPGGKVAGNIVNRFHSPASDSWRASGIILYGNNFASIVIEGNEVFDADYGITMTNGASGSTITRNYLHGNKTGVMFEARAAGNTVTGNNITENLQGIQIHGGLSGNVTGNKPPGIGNSVSGNAIAGNDTGVVSFDDTRDFDARDNWWGSADPDFNNLISGSVVYTPWRGASPIVTSSVINVPTVSRSSVVPPPTVVPEIIPLSSPEEVLPAPFVLEKDKKEKEKDKSKEDKLKEVSETSSPADGEGGGALFDVLVSPEGVRVSQQLMVPVIVSVILGILLAPALVFGIPWLLRWWKKRVREKRMRE